MNTFCCFDVKSYSLSFLCWVITSPWLLVEPIITSPSLLEPPIIFCQTSSISSILLAHQPYWLHKGWLSWWHVDCSLVEWQCPLVKHNFRFVKLSSRWNTKPGIPSAAGVSYPSNRDVHLSWMISTSGSENAGIPRQLQVQYLLVGKQQLYHDVSPVSNIFSQTTYSI